MKRSITLFFAIAGLISLTTLNSEDGYRLWLRYDPVTDKVILEQYSKAIKGWLIEGDSPTIRAANSELEIGPGRGNTSSPEVKDGFVAGGTPGNSKLIASPGLNDKLAKLGNEGYLILSTRFRNKKITVIAGNTDIGVLYRIFNFLRLIQMNMPVNNLNISSSPETRIRILNHWDNLNRSVEKGYSGLSLWDWNSLPDSVMYSPPRRG